MRASEPPQHGHHIQNITWRSHTDESGEGHNKTFVQLKQFIFMTQKNARGFIVRCSNANWQTFRVAVELSAILINKLRLNATLCCLAWELHGECLHWWNMIVAQCNQGLIASSPSRRQAPHRREQLGLRELQQQSCCRENLLSLNGTTKVKLINTVSLFFLVF